MLGNAWMGLFSRIPLMQQDGLGIVTASGLEINLQSVMRMEEEYVVVRGRIMGSTDANRTFFVPYDQINTLIFQRVLKEEEIQAWYSDKPLPKPVEAPKPAQGETPPTETPAAEAESPTPMIQPMATPTSSTPMSTPGKTAILERLRKRTTDNAAGRPPAKSDDASAPKTPGK